MIWIGDDVGTQRGMLMSVRLWRTWLKPRLDRIWKVLIGLLAVLAIVGFWGALMSAGPLVAVAVCLTTIGALVVGHALGGPDPATRTAVAISSSARNPGLALLVVAVNGAPLGVTVSIGAATSPDGEVAPRELIRRADELIQAGLVSADPAVRREAYAKCQDAAWPMAPWGYLFVDTLIAAKSKNLKGIIVKGAGRATIAEEIPEAYKDVQTVVDVAHGAGISRKVAKLRPLGVIKG